MSRVQVKICGITNLEDAQVAAAAGADFLGFIMSPPSKRAIDPADVAKISAEIRKLEQPPKLVGVFVDEPIEWMLGILKDCQLDLIQLHGSEVPSMVNDPNGLLYGKAYKALRPQSINEAEAEVEWFVAEHRDVLPTILIDSFHPTLKGGTGELSDWEIARVMTGFTRGLMLAGGLTPDNVARAVREVLPFAVDVASGVEAEPGRKDHEKVRAFIENAKSVSVNGKQ